MALDTSSNAAPNNFEVHLGNVTLVSSVVKSLIPDGGPGVQLQVTFALGLAGDVPGGASSWVEYEDVVKDDVFVLDFDGRTDIRMACGDITRLSVYCILQLREPNDEEPCVVASTSVNLASHEFGLLVPLHESWLEMESTITNNIAVTVRVKQIPDYGHKTSDVFNVEDTNSDDGSETDMFHAAALERLKNIHNDIAGDSLNERLLFKTLSSRMLDSTFHSIDYLEDMLWESSILNSLRLRSPEEGPAIIYQPKLSTFPRLKQTGGIDGRDEFLCFRPMWEPIKEDYELLFSLQQFNSPVRAGQEPQPDDTLQFAAETGRDYLRWVVALASICSTGTVPEVMRHVEASDARDRTTLPFYLQTAPDCLQGWLMRKKRHVNKLSKVTWVRRYCWLTFRQGVWLLEYAASPTGDVRHNLELNQSVVLQLPREFPAPPPYGLEVTVTAIRDSLNLALEGYRCAAIMKLRTGPKVCQVSTGQLKRDASESKRNLASEEDPAMRELYSTDEMLMRGIYRGRDMFTVLPVPAKYAMHWPTDDNPGSAAAAIGARRRSSATNTQLKMDFGMIDLYLMQDSPRQVMIGPASFSLSEVEAEREKEFQMTMNPRDRGISAQQHEVHITVSVKATRFRVPFTYWPARATTTHTEGDLLYTPCHILASPASLMIRSKFEDDSHQELAIQYQYVVDALPLGPCTLFLAVLLQGPDEINLSHIRYGQVALIQVSPCPAKQLCALIRDRAALSKDQTTIMTVLREVPANSPKSEPALLSTIYDSMVSLRSSLSEMHRMTEKQQSEPAAGAGRGATAVKARPDALSIVGLFGRKALQTRRFCERWYRLRLFITKLRDLNMLTSWQQGEMTCSLDDHVAIVLDSLYHRELNASKHLSRSLRNITAEPDNAEGPDIVVTTLKATERLDSIIRQLWFTVADETGFCCSVETAVVSFLARILHELNRQLFSLMDHRTQVEPAHVRMLGFLLRADSLFGAIAHKYDLTIEPDIRLSTFIDTKSLITNFALAVGMKSCSSTAASIWQMCQFKPSEPSTYFAKLTSDGTFRCNWVREVTDLSELIIAPICEFARNHKQIVVSCLSSLATCLHLLREYVLQITEFLPYSDDHGKYKRLFDEEGHRWDPRVTHLCAIINSCRLLVENVCQRMGVDFENYEMDGLPSFPTLGEMYKTLAVKAGSELVELSFLDIHALTEKTFHNMSGPTEGGGVSIGQLFVELRRSTEVIRGWTDDGTFKERLMEMFAERVLSSYLIHLTAWLRSTVLEGSERATLGSMQTADIAAVKLLSERESTNLVLSLQELKDELQREFGRVATRAVGTADEVLHAITMNAKGLQEYINKGVFKRHQGREYQLLELLELIVSARGDIKEKDKLALVNAFRQHLPPKDGASDIRRTTSYAPPAVDALQWIPFGDDFRSSFTSENEEGARRARDTILTAGPLPTTAFVQYLQRRKQSEMRQMLRSQMFGQLSPHPDIVSLGSLSPRFSGSKKRLTVRKNTRAAEKQLQCSVRLTDIVLRMHGFVPSRTTSVSGRQSSPRVVRHLSSNADRDEAEVPLAAPAINLTDESPADQQADAATATLAPIRTDIDGASGASLKLVVHVGEKVATTELAQQSNSSTPHSESVWGFSTMLDAGISLATNMAPNGVGSLTIDVFYDSGEGTPATPQPSLRDSVDSRGFNVGQYEYLGFVALPLAPVWHFFPNEGAMITANLCSDKAEVSFKIRSVVGEDNLLL